MTNNTSFVIPETPVYNFDNKQVGTLKPADDEYVFDEKTWSWKFVEKNNQK